MELFTTVKALQGKADFANLAITFKGVDAKSKEDMKLVCQTGDFNIDNLSSNIQTHSDIVNVIDESNIGQKIEGDALVTNVSRVPLLIFTADCVPIAIMDPKHKAIGLAHAGWRGTYDKIAKNTIDKMKELYNTEAKDVVAVIGPSIGPCCYEVSEELIEKFNMNFTNSGEKLYTIEEGKFKLDLWKVNEYILKSVGVKKENIINLNLCTSCESEKFHSYRIHNQTPKRIGTILEIK